MIDLTSKIVFITGAGGEIGSATARTLVQAGAEVVLHDLSTEALAGMSSDLGASAHSLTSDLGNPLATGDLWDRAVAVHGRIDVLVNMAGVYLSAPIDEPLDGWLNVWEKSLAINLVSPGVLCRGAVRTFAEQPNGGIVINIASRAAFRGEDPDYWHYAAAKAGIVAMTKTIARHYGRQGVTRQVMRSIPARSGMKTTSKTISRIVLEAVVFHQSWTASMAHYRLAPRVPGRWHFGHRFGPELPNCWKNAEATLLEDEISA